MLRLDALERMKSTIQYFSVAPSARQEVQVTRTVEFNPNNQRGVEVPPMCLMRRDAADNTHQPAATQ